jgi:hypothetical protein
VRQVENTLRAKGKVGFIVKAALIFRFVLGGFIFGIWALGVAALGQNF